MTNISKGQDLLGNHYFQGWDYFSCEPIIVYGKYNGLMNGDNVLVFAKYRDLGTDDMLYFSGFFLEIVNNRGIN